jgi:hypothetical protein
MTHLEAIEFVANHNVQVRMIGKGMFELDGFYKSGDARVILGENGQDTRIETRYGRVNTVPATLDLVDALIELNDEWYEDSKDRFAGWEDPDRNWAYVKKIYQAM